MDSGSEDTDVDSGSDEESEEVLSDDDLNISSGSEDEGPEAEDSEDETTKMLNNLANELAEYSDSDEEEDVLTPGILSQISSAGGFFGDSFGVASVPYQGNPAPLDTGVNISQPLFTPVASWQSQPTFVIQQPQPQPITSAQDLALRPEVASKIAQVGIPKEIVGTLEDNLKKYLGEPENHFVARCSVARAIVNPPYSLDIRSALIVSRIWAEKGLTGVVYSKEIEEFLNSISTKQ